MLRSAVLEVKAPHSHWKLKKPTAWLQGVLQKMATLQSAPLEVKGHHRISVNAGISQS